MNNNILRRIVSAVLCFVLIGGALAGCSPAMRKKFVRQKKKMEEDDAFIPVLEPIDYPNTLETVKTRYDYFYALLKVWHKDALMLIDDEHTDKQIKYTITQIKIQLEELGKIFEGDAEEAALAGIIKVDEVLAYYDKPESFRNRDIIRKSLQRLTDSVIKPLSFENIRDDLKR